MTHRIITTRAEWLDALRAGFDEAAKLGCRELWLIDPDFADWPLSEPAVLDALARWALPHRRLALVARSYEALRRRHPRFVEWRRQWGHVVDARQFEEAEPEELPSLLLAPGVVTVRLFDREHLRGSVSHEAADGIRAREVADALSQRSVEAFPATTLGL